jgi:hypothetical protein
MRACSASIHHRLDTCTVTQLPIFDILSDFNYDAGTLVPRRPHSEGRHGNAKVIKHIVDIGLAKPGDVELDENVVWTWRPVSSPTMPGSPSLLPGSGTGTVSTLTLKSGPAFSITPALQ